MRDRKIEKLIKALKDKDSTVRSNAAMALGETEDPEAFDPLLEALKDKNGEVRGGAAYGIGYIGDTRAVDPLNVALKDQEGVVLVAAQALGKMGDTRAFDDQLKEVLLEQVRRIEGSSDVGLKDLTFNDKKGSIISAILWMTILSILLGWIPIFGSLIAGYVGGKKAGSVSNAVIAVALPALLLAVFIYTVFSSIPIVGALIAGAAFTIVIVYNLILVFGAVMGGARAGA